jgi:hypothetical protein
VDPAGEEFGVANPKVKMLRAAGGDYGFAFDNKKATKLTGRVRRPCSGTGSR